MIAPAPLPIDVPDLSGPIPAHVAELIARLLLEVADRELQAEAEAGETDTEERHDDSTL